MKKIEKVVQQIEKDIFLDKKQLSEIKKQTKIIIEKLNKSLQEKEKIFIGGSLAKKTLIKKEVIDIDIFVIFNQEQDTKKLESYLSKAKIKAKKIHGSRDYFQLENKNIVFEFIPIVKINKKNQNITDFSPLHVKYINKKTNEKLLREIKIAKAFFSAQEVYGAESYIKGFSGYAIELLVCYYGSFEKLLKRIGKDDFIDIERKFKNKKQAFQEINESKLSSPLLVVDPTEKYRNVCAGLSKKTLEKLIESSRKFIEKPSPSFFEKQEFNEKTFFENEISKKRNLIILEMETERDNQDIAATKMKKFFEFFIKQLEKNQQKIKQEKFVFLKNKKSKGYISFQLEKTLEIQGPKKSMEKAIENFKKARKKIYFSKGYAFAKENFSIEEFVKKTKKTSKDMDIKFSWKSL